MSNNLEKAKKQIFSHRPTLQEIIENNGSLSLVDYVQKTWQVAKDSLQEDFLLVLQEKALEIYGSNIAEQAVNQLKQKPLVSTVDHLGLWGHPFFVNADLIYSLQFNPAELGIVLATESISLNNTWSSSIIVHEKNKLTQYSFLSEKEKTLPVFCAPKISQKDINSFSQRKSEFSNLVDTLDLSAPASNFSEQVAIASFKFWQTVFPSAPKILYLPLETIVLDYLVRVFKDPNNIFSKIILSSNGQELWRKYFGMEHTFMFWGIGENNRREVLKTLPEKNELINLIMARKIYPSSPLCFAVLLFAGLTCSGGFNQTTWLTQTKEKFLQLLLEMEEDAAVKKVTTVATKNFSESSLAWLVMENNYITPTSADLCLRGKDLYSIYKELAGKLTLEQSFELAIPEIYTVAVPKNEQNIEFKLMEEERQKLLNKYLTSIKGLL